MPGTSADNASMASTGMYSNFMKGSAGGVGNRPRPVNCGAHGRGVHRVSASSWTSGGAPKRAHLPRGGCGERGGRRRLCVGEVALIDEVVPARRDRRMADRGARNYPV